MSIVSGDEEAPSLRGCSPTETTSGSAHVPHVTPDGDWMYVIENGSVRRFQISNAANVETIAVGEGALDLSSDASVYWVGTGGLKKTAK